MDFGMSPNGDAPTQRHRVVVIGGGFGGLQAAQHLATAPVDLTIVDRRNFHLFQPLTYQVATGALSPGEVAYPLRAIFRRHRNVRVLIAEVTGFDLDGRRVHLGLGLAALRHVDRRRRLALLLLRPRRLAPLRARRSNRSRARSRHVHGS